MKRTFLVEPNEEHMNEFWDILREFNKKQPGYVFPENYAYLYYDDNEKLIGGVSFEIQNEWLNIDTLAINEDIRGNGYGSKFLKEAEEFGISKGCTKSYLYTYVFQARKFYEKFGYKVENLRKTKGGLLDKYLMIKDLVQVD
jgi:GNAT superfamily N-acetyltransferase